MNVRLVAVGLRPAPVGRRAEAHQPIQAAPRDDEPLDLARPLSDLGQLGVAQVALDRVLGHVAVAAVDLDRGMVRTRELTSDAKSFASAATSE